jgi:hypothetical protein
MFRFDHFSYSGRTEFTTKFTKNAKRNKSLSSFVSFVNFVVSSMSFNDVACT